MNLLNKDDFWMCSGGYVYDETHSLVQVELLPADDSLDV